MTSQLRAVITGGGSGLGRALALEVARRRGRVVIADIDQAGANETAGQVENAGAEAHVVLCDVADREAMDALAARSGEILGTVDLVANNAGVAVGGPFEDIEVEDWKWIVDINLWGVIYGCRAFYPVMKDRGRGYIINVASAAGLVSMPMMSAYNVTKAGVVALSETLHGEGKRYGVNVSVLCPTFFTTNIAHAARSSFGEGDRERILEAMRRSRVQAPQVARAAVDAVLAGRLYALPMRDGRFMWRLKRMAPHSFYRLVRGPIMSMVERRIARSSDHS